MFKFAFLIGLYSYSIFFLGLLHLLYFPYLFSLSLLFLLLIILPLRKYKLFTINPILYKDKIILFSLGILILQLLINLIGVLGPEISFDALWYHLTIPKIFLLQHSVFHIPGNLLYYSDMPKNIEMIYITALSLGSEILAKLIHFTFGVLIVLVIYRIAKKYLNLRFALFACIIFVSNLVFGWESITAYIDLGRTFFEILALYYVLVWAESKDTKNIYKSAVLLGFAIATKLIAFASLPVFLGIISYVFLTKNLGAKRNLFKKLLVFSSISFLIPSPWFIFSFLHTGDPFYPFVSFLRLSLGNVFSLQYFIGSFKELFIYSQDPINPIYVILLPLAIVGFTKFRKPFRIISIYCFLSLAFWYFTPKMGGGRFILPYLPVFSILAAYIIMEIKNKSLNRYLILLIFIFSLMSIFYRGMANSKFLPVVLGRETKTQFLTDRLNFKFGDFYDTDNYFGSNIKSKDVILLYGFHNLYYVNFPFIDSSYVKKGDKFNFIATQWSDLPERFSNWKLIYYNQQTGVSLYSLGGKEWIY